MSGALSNLVSQLETVLFRTQRQIAAIIPDCVVEERHIDRLAVTGQPVQIGAEITDHSYVIPSEVTLRYSWSNSSFANALASGIGPAGVLGFGSEDYVTDVYTQLRALQTSRQPFTVVTGKRRYDNMLMPSLAILTDRDNEYQLSVVAVVRNVNLVPIMAASVPAASQAQPAKTADTQHGGAEQPKLELNRGSILSQIGTALGLH